MRERERERGGLVVDAGEDCSGDGSRVFQKCQIPRSSSSKKEKNTTTHVVEECPELVVVLLPWRDDHGARAVVPLVDDHDIAGGNGTRAVDAAVGTLLLLLRFRSERGVPVPSARRGWGSVVGVAVVAVILTRNRRSRKSSDAPLCA